MRTHSFGFFESISTKSKKHFSSSIQLPSNFKPLMMQPDPAKVNKLAAQKKRMTQVMRKKFPKIMSGTFQPGRMVYRLCDLTPEEMIRNGGFKTPYPLYMANTRTGNGEGSICFSLLPSVTTIFNNNFAKNKTRYLYACLLSGDYFAPGGEWRQVIIPRVFPIPSVWMAREVITTTEDRQFVLGPMVGHIHSNEEVIWGESFNEFSQPSIQAPVITNYGHEHEEMEFAIIDTEESRIFQENVEQFYQQQYDAEFPRIFSNH